MSTIVPIVFIVDDDVSVRESLEALIRYVGWQSISFATAQEFLSHPPARGPSCLLLDINLPDVNGLELQKEIAISRSEMPIIFMTGDSDVPITVTDMKAGAVEFLIKPLSYETLLAAMRNAIAKSSVLRDYKSAGAKM